MLVGSKFRSSSYYTHSNRFLVVYNGKGMTPVCFKIASRLIGPSTNIFHCYLNWLLRGHANSDFTKLETWKFKNPQFWHILLYYPSLVSQNFFFAAVSYISSHCVNPLSKVLMNRRSMGHMVLTFLGPYGPFLRHYLLTHNYQRHGTFAPLFGNGFYYRPRSEGDNALGSVCPSVRLSVWVYPGHIIRMSVCLSVCPSVCLSVCLRSHAWTVWLNYREFLSKRWQLHVRKKLSVCLWSVGVCDQGSAQRSIGVLIWIRVLAPI